VICMELRRVLVAMSDVCVFAADKPR